MYAVRTRSINSTLFGRWQQRYDLSVSLLQRLVFVGSLGV